MIYEIFIPARSEPQTNLEMSASMSFFPSEQEVVLLPFFNFQVIGIREVPDPVKPHTIITVVEIPGQNLLRMRTIEMSPVLWIDSGLMFEKSLP